MNVLYTYSLVNCFSRAPWVYDRKSISSLESSMQGYLFGAPTAFDRMSSSSLDVELQAMLLSLFNNGDTKKKSVASRAQR